MGHLFVCPISTYITFHAKLFLSPRYHSATKSPAGCGAGARATFNSNSIRGRGLFTSCSFLNFGAKKVLWRCFCQIFFLTLEPEPKFFRIHFFLLRSKSQTSLGGLFGDPSEPEPDSFLLYRSDSGSQD